MGYLSPAGPGWSGYGLAPRVRPPRNVLLVHGTTLPRAQNVVRNQRMDQRETFFALGWRNRDLARIFAHRASRRSPRQGPPALVVASVPEELIDRLRQQRLMRMTGFDSEDAPALRGRSQWVVSPGGMEVLNREVAEWRMVRMGPPASPASAPGNLAGWDGFGCGERWRRGCCASGCAASR